MYQIQLTRRAIKNLQKLQSTGSLKIPQMLFEPLANTPLGEEFLHTKHLSGYPDLWRSRVNPGGGGSLRLIWTTNREDHSIKFLYADQRDDNTYELDLNQLPQEPTYQWNQETGSEWSLFLNGGYNTSPVLTQNQKKLSDKVASDIPDHLNGKRIDFPATITQSPPGTGKTIVAADRAYDRYNAGWNIIFIVPQSLVEHVKAFHCIRSLPSDLSQGFFCNTFYNYITQFFPGFSNLVLSPEEELEILQDLAKKAKQSGKKIQPDTIEMRDVLLYQLFVLKEDQNTDKNTVYQGNKGRIKDLSFIASKWWDERIKKLGKKSRCTMAADILAQTLKDTPINLLDPERFGTLLIVDEAQDYLLSEINILKAFCKKLQQTGHRTHLWLLGDLNQRVTPVDFNWGALGLGTATVPDWKCFRNSKNILRFSNSFLTPVHKKARKNNEKYSYLPKDTDLDQCDQDGDLVKLIKYPSERDAENSLEKLACFIGSKKGEIAKSRSLIHRLVSRVQILQSESSKLQYKDELEILNVHQVKGREFDSCIIFNIFKFKGGEPIYEDWWQWYTLLTRTRSRLLVIVTNEQFEMLEHHIPEISSKCEIIDSNDFEEVDRAYQWIQAEGNDLEWSTGIQDVVEHYLCDGLQLSQPLIYWDTYEVLDQVGIIGADRTTLERKLLSLLRDYSSEILQSELTLATKEATNPLLHCLLMRAMGQSWSAVHSIEALKEVNEMEYERVIQAICQDLEGKKLFVESARIQFQKLSIPYPKDLPMPEIAPIETNLLTALINILQSGSYRK